MVAKFEEGLYGVWYNDFIPILTRGLKEQQELIEKIREENSNLKDSVQEQKIKLSNFESRLNKLENKKINNHLPAIIMEKLHKCSSLIIMALQQYRAVTKVSGTYLQF